MLESVEHKDVKEAIDEAKQRLGASSNLIVRKSGTEPVIKLRVEDKDGLIVREIAENLKAIISKYQK